jgi:hypothetical protein
MDKNYIKTSKITLAIGLVLIILALLYVYGASNPKQIVTDENVKIGYLFQLPLLPQFL